MPDDAGSLLLRAGLVAEDQIAAARAAAREHGGTLPEHLVLAGAVEDEALTAFYRNHLLVPRVEPQRLERLSAPVVDRLPGDMATELRTIPVALDRDGNLTVAMSDPSDTHAVDEIAFFTGSYVVRAVATQEQIARALARYYDHRTLLFLQLADDDPALPPLADDAEEDTDVDRTQPRRREPRDTPETQPLPAKEVLERQRATSPPELAARSGELEAHGGADHDVEALPSVVLDEAAIAAAIEAPHGSHAAPILLDRRAPLPPVEIEEVLSPSAGVPRAYEEAARLEPSAPRRRPHRPTRLGTGVGGGIPGPITDGAGTIPMAVPPVAGHRPQVRATPEPVEDGRATQRIRIDGGRVSIENVDDGWGPPGTTIPPSAQGAEAAPPPAASGERIATLVDASAALLETLRRLEAAGDRERIVGVVLEHLGQSFQQTGFLALRRDALVPWGVPGRGAPPVGAALPIDRDATLSDVVRSRLPYRGPLTDRASRDLLAQVFGRAPDELLAVPVTVHDRTVGVLVGASPRSEVVVEHLAVLLRALSDALERLVASRKLQR